VQPTTPRPPGAPARPDVKKIVWPRRATQAAPSPPPPGSEVPPLPRPPQQQPPYFDWHRAIRIGAVVAAALLLTGGVAWTRCGIRGCPDVGRLAAYQPDGAPMVLDRYGREVGTLALVNRRVVELKDLPAHVADAFIAVEDRRFRQHHGVDPQRIFGALLANLRAGGIRQGSSTITMQLARNLFPERIPGQHQTLSRKLLEARVAGSIERAYDKDEILELYLNHIYFGGGTRGIEAASQYYFRHPASRLTLSEAALLAAMPKAPTHYDPRRHATRARERRDLVLTLMEKQGRIDHAAAEAARQRSLGVSRRPRKLVQAEPFAGWFLEEVRRQLEDRFGDGFYSEKMRIVTTLDAGAQRAAERELDAQLLRIEGGAWGRFRGTRYSAAQEGDEEGTDYLQGAVIFVEAKTGDVLTWVGGRDFRDSRFDRVEQARRQVGSAFKPFVYAAAIAAGIPPTQRLSDEPLEIRFTGGEVWRPRNFGDSYLPSVTVRDALVQSRNVATVRLAESVGIERIADLAEESGLPKVPLQPSSALGASSATPLELTRAYTAFANLGTQVRPRFILRVEDADGKVLWSADDDVDGKQVIDPAVAYVVTDLLRDAVRRGTGAPAAAVGLAVPAAGKTGTTNERQDVWFAGYTPDVVGTVWIGFDQPHTIVHGASGGTLAAPVWGRIVRNLYSHRPRPAGWGVPAGVVQRRVDAVTGDVLGDGCPPASGRSYREVFLAGAEPPTVCPAGQNGGPGWWQRVQGWFGAAPPPYALPEAAPTPMLEPLTPPADLESLPYGQGEPPAEGEATDLTPFAPSREPGTEAAPTGGELPPVEPSVAPPAAPAAPPQQQPPQTLPPVEPAQPQPAPEPEEPAEAAPEPEPSGTPPPPRTIAG
jgi:penicillin-binding protein 1A